MTHGTHGVVALVAVQGPVSRLISDELDLPHLANGYVSGDLRPSRGGRNRTSVCAGDFKLDSVDMDRMVGHRQVAHPDPYAITQACDDRTDRRIHGAVKSPDIEIKHGVDIGCFASWLHIEGIEQEAIIPIHLGDEWVRCFGMCHPESHHAHRHLGHFIGMWVIHERARPLGDEFIDEGFPDRNGLLVQPADTIHAIG